MRFSFLVLLHSNTVNHVTNAEIGLIMLYILYIWVSYHEFLYLVVIRMETLLLKSRPYICMYVSMVELMRYSI